MITVTSKDGVQFLVRTSRTDAATVEAEKGFARTRLACELESFGEDFIRLHDIGQLAPTVTRSEHWSGAAYRPRTLSPGEARARFVLIRGGKS